MGFYMVLCKAERREHYDDFYGDRRTAERRVRRRVPVCEKISVIPMICNTLGTTFISLSTLPSHRWNITKIVECAQLRRDVKIDVGDAVVVPLFVIFIIAAIVNFPLMWLQIVQKTKKLQHGVRSSRNRIHYESLIHPHTSLYSSPFHI